MYLCLRDRNVLWVFTGEFGLARRGGIYLLFAYPVYTPRLAVIHSAVPLILVPLSKLRICS